MTSVEALPSAAAAGRVGRTRAAVVRHTAMSAATPFRPPSGFPLTRRRFALLALAALPAGVVARAAPPPDPPGAGKRLDFQIDGDFGEAGPQDIKAVVTSAGDAIWRHCPNVRWETPGFRLYHSADSPITLFDHRPDGRISIGVTTRGTFWAQLAFQFSHEFCHALAGHSGDWKAKQEWLRRPKSNHWLEECLCETASLFALRAMAKSWETRPPYPNWKPYANALADYAADRLEATAKALPAGFAFRTWLRQHEPAMRENPTLRADNNVVARELLPLFERTPSAWEAVAHYHGIRRDPAQSLKDRLADWHQATPPVCRPIIRGIAEVCGVTPA